LLPDELIPEVRVPLGNLLEGENPKIDFSGPQKLVTVGDQCAVNIARQGFIPDVAIVDYRVKRHKIEKPPELERFDVVLGLKNPAGMISKDAWPVIGNAFSTDKSTRIDVDGEEDLLALPSIALAPDGTTVTYGLPHKGLVIVTVNHDVKMKVIDIMKRMVVKGGD
jgi:uncharacterized protein (UPF0218 family)